MSRLLEEHVYIGLAEVSSAGKTSENTKTFVQFSEETNKGLNFKATELKLGLPGSESPERVPVNVADNDEFNGAKNLFSGAKRMFSDAINGGSNKWVLLKNGGCQAASLKDMGDEKKLQSSPVSEQGTVPFASSKAQVVGWPPIRSFRKNSMTTNAPKINDNKDCKLDPGCHFIKVSMDGAPYLRKIDLKTYSSYVGLSSALEKMFSGFTMGQNGKKGLECQESSKVKLTDALQHSEYVLTYEDKDGDWMLVGDVPFHMFLDTCRRLRIMKSSDAVGLASISCDG